ncbi:pantetheine-phosphate adenylyltransferase [Curtobacterium sp. MCBD17_013]|uniref:pantetheine-phosphate adenylyltransferase n=1 Tax=unclassified Curtobacterium TaxID=257496 RepID=UPI000DA86CDE|nr:MULTISPECIES: pantetheine-phosphate adenylyltransferase [unclassified Curtobacterium]PZF65356.1 pantetheine-phosphate adenylyltransferase [Curtobacterium sp. MCBD17_013]WIB62468.1 pantetheine-phosphate adenylyltransferase [Curtobacterium sp. MCBD17_040]
MPQIAVVPGSFDPVTVGHLDVIQRAATIFDEVHVLVVHNPDKTSSLFDAAERVRLIDAALDEAGLHDGVRVESWSSGLLVDYCRQVGARVIVKGVRSSADVAYETPMAAVNRDLAGVETVFVVPEPGRSHVSSSLVRQVASLGGDVSPYVPRVVAEALAH